MSTAETNLPDIETVDVHGSQDILGGKYTNYAAREGELLAGDSGRKIAEVIDLQGAIYHIDGMAWGGNVNVCVFLCVSVYFHAFQVFARKNGKGKRTLILV